MKRFTYLQADSFAAAGKALREAPDAMAKAGGTDLLDLMKERVVEPDSLVTLHRIAAEGAGGEISALRTLADVAGDERIRADFPALAKAAGDAATPQIRNFGTVGGNLCQHTRCWYFRNSGYDCFKRGGSGCAALADTAQNRYHAIFPHERCGCAHPSSLAPALIALGAKAAVVGAEAEMVVDLEELYRPPKSGQISDTVLRKGELIRALILAPSAMTRRSTYVEFRERDSFDFALVSVAAAVDLTDGVVRDARIVLGAVAPTPWRAREAENALRGKPLDPAAAAEAALAGARPLSQAAYKVTIAKTLVRRALEELKR